VKKLRELMGYIFYKPALARLVPTCLLHDFIEHALTRDNMEEKRELIKAIPKDRIISEIPKLKQVSNNLLPPKFVICIHSYKSN
jgi:hypothetical protein